jgi:hypothetical protein
MLRVHTWGRSVNRESRFRVIGLLATVLWMAAAGGSRRADADGGAGQAPDADGDGGADDDGDDGDDDGIGAETTQADLHILTLTATSDQQGATIQWQLANENYDTSGGFGLDLAIFPEPSCDAMGALGAPDPAPVWTRGFDEKPLEGQSTRRGRAVVALSAGAFDVRLTLSAISEEDTPEVVPVDACLTVTP